MEYECTQIKNIEHNLAICKKKGFTHYQGMMNVGLEGLKIWRIKRSMEYAAKHGEIFHLWWHPHNFGQDMVENLDNLEQLCKHYKQLSQEYEYKSCFISEITT